MLATTGQPVVIALGSNIDPEENLASAAMALAKWLRLRGLSRVYRTPPWGVLDQPDFLNAVIAAECDQAPLEILDRLLKLEDAQIRVRTVPNGPRTIDLDLIYCGNMVMASPRLTLPHPRMHERAFVLCPLCDVLPESTHPVTGLTPVEMVGKVDRTGVEPVEFQWPVGISPR